MGSFKKVVVAMVGICAVGSFGEEICGYLPSRTGVGRSSSTAYDAKADWCPGQIEACGWICGGKTVSNTCTLSSPTYACYECECASGSTPELAIYQDTIPQRICEQRISNCAASPSGSFLGQCDAMPKCGSINADPTPAKVWPSEISSVAPVVSTPEPVLIHEPLIAAVKEPETITNTAPVITSSSAAVETSAATSTSSSSVSSIPSTISKTLSLATSSTIGLNTTSSISTSASVSSSTQSTSTSTTLTSTRTSSRSSSTSAVSTSALQAAAAMMTSVPWMPAAIGVAGLVLAGL